MINLSINSAVYHCCSPDWHWDTFGSLWKDYDLWYVSGGEGSLETPEGRFKVNRGSCFVLRPGSRYIGSHNPGRPLRVYAVHFIPPEGLEFPLAVLVDDPGFFDTLFERLIQAEKQDQKDWLAVLLLEYQRSAVDKTSLPTINEQRVRQLEQHIRDNIDKPLILQDLADLLNLSKNQLMRIYKEERHCTVLEYIQDQRIQIAMMNLTMTTLPVKRIAEMSGYRDASFFCRQFRRLVGCSPINYREGRRFTSLPVKKNIL